MGLHLLHFGVDTLEATFDGDLADGTAERLGHAKQLAQQSNKPQPVMVGPSEFFVDAKGAGMYQWRLSDSDLLLRVACDGSPVPLVSARLRASALATFGHEALYQDAVIAAAALGADTQYSITRLDLAADLQGWVPTPGEMAGIVCPATYRAHHTDGAGFTFQYGKGQIVTRIYNKSAEIVARGHQGYAELWHSRLGYDPEQPVVRVEVQFRREALKEHGCRFVHQAFVRLPELFAAGLAWSDLRVPTSDAKKSRWPRHPVWDWLATSVCVTKPQPRVRHKSRLLDKERVLRRFVGACATYAAYGGGEELSVIVEAMVPDALALIESEDLDLARMIEDKRARIASGSSTPF